MTKFGGGENGTFYCCVERGGLGKMLMALLFMDGLLRYFGQMKIIDV